MKKWFLPIGLFFLVAGLAVRHYWPSYTASFECEGSGELEHPSFNELKETIAQVASNHGMELAVFTGARYFASNQMQLRQDEFYFIRYEGGDIFVRPWAAAATATSMDRCNDDPLVQYRLVPGVLKAGVFHPWSKEEIAQAGKMEGLFVALATLSGNGAFPKSLEDFLLSPGKAEQIRTAVLESNVDWKSSNEVNFIDGGAGFFPRMFPATTHAEFVITVNYVKE